MKRVRYYSHWYILVNEDEADQIIEDRKPLGLFVLATEDRYVGIDNRTGDAWVEEFSGLRECLDWLFQIKWI